MSLRVLTMDIRASGTARDPGVLVAVFAECHEFQYILTGYPECFPVPCRIVGASTMTLSVVMHDYPVSSS